MLKDFIKLIFKNSKDPRKTKTFLQNFLRFFLNFNLALYALYFDPFA